jgi:ribonuclease PH
MRGLVSAMSVGLRGDELLVDLDRREDNAAEADLNVICASDGKLIEVQGAAEGAPFAVEQFHEMVSLGQRSCESVDKLQRQSLGL